MAKRAGFCLAVLLLVIFTACKKDNSIGSSETITTSIFGRVVDESNKGIYGAVATIGNTSATTDMNGVFIIKNVATDKYHAFVKVSRLGYFDGSRTFTAAANSMNTVNIQLIKKNLSGTFSAGSGATINLTNASVTFPANAIKDANGSIYTGVVNVYATFLDPTDADLQTKMPGDLIGIDTSNAERLLRSFGMMNVELEDAAGNKLNIATGKEATLSMTVPSSLLSAAPATIPMWYFDTETGLWKEEGSSTLTGNKYVGNVKHFTYWNNDTRLPAVNVTFRLVDQDGNPLSNTPVQFSNSSLSLGAAHGNTDNNGRASGMVPSNVVLRMEYVDNCRDLNFVRNIGPLTGNQINRQRDIIDLGDIVVNLAATINQTATYIGVLTSCNDAPISNGYVKYIFYDNEHAIPVDANGRFSFTLIKTCPGQTTLNVTGLAYNNNNDFSSYNISVPKFISFTGGNNDLGNIMVCSDSIFSVSNFQFQNGVELQFQVDDDEIISLYVRDSIIYSVNATQNETIYTFFGYSDSSLLPLNLNKSTLFFIKDNATGNLSLQIAHFDTRGLSSHFHYLSYQPPFTYNGVGFAINIPSSIGQYYEGRVKGVIYDVFERTVNGYDINKPHIINCAFKIKKTI